MLFMLNRPSPGEGSRKINFDPRFSKFEILKPIVDRNKEAKENEFSAIKSINELNDKPIQKPSEYLTEQTPEKMQEWFDLTKAKLELVSSREQLDLIIKQFNAHYEYSQNDQVYIKDDMLVSVPEGDFLIKRNFPTNQGEPTEEMFAVELSPYKIGDTVTVERTSLEKENDWTVSGFDTKDTAYGPERIIIVQKLINDEPHTERYTAKKLREINR